MKLLGRLRQGLSKNRGLLSGLTLAFGLVAGALVFAETGSWWLAILAMISGLVLMRVWWRVEFRTASHHALRAARRDLGGGRQISPSGGGGPGSREAVAASKQALDQCRDLGDRVAILALEVADLNVQLRSSLEVS